MYTIIKFCTLVLVLTKNVHSQKCNDCVTYNSCPKAFSLAKNNRTEETIKLFRTAFCGFDNNSRISIAMVCCSVFSTSDSGNSEENHRNLNLLPTECGVIQGDRIVGGSIADLYEFPWMTLISYFSRNGLSFKCGGSIINKRYILTAAHCVKNKMIAGVRVGEYNIDTNIDCTGKVCENHLQDIQVERSIIHEKYQGLPIVLNDIALLRVAEDIDFSHMNVLPICLPTTDGLRNRVLSNEIATVAGWGLTENNTESSILRKVNIPIHTPERCSNLYNRFARPGDVDATTNQFCAGAENKDSCSGDSGGPLMLEDKYNNAYRYIQYGVVSHGPKRCGSNFPGVYTDVPKFMTWILDNISS